MASQTNKSTSLKAWDIQGPDAVSYYRSAQVTWWSILQGLSAGALLIQTPVMLQKLQLPDWYVVAAYYLASALISVNLWVQYSWAGLAFRWPIDPLHATLVFVNGMSLAIACTLITDPGAWYIAMAVFMVSGDLIMLYNLRQIQRSDWKENTKKAMHKLVLLYAYQTIAITVVVIIACWNLNTHPSSNTYAIWGGVALAGNFINMFSQHYDMKKQKELLQIP